MLQKMVSILAVAGLLTYVGAAAGGEEAVEVSTTAATTTTAYTVTAEEQQAGTFTVLPPASPGDGSTPRLDEQGNIRDCRSDDIIRTTQTFPLRQIERVELDVTDTPDDYNVAWLMLQNTDGALVQCGAAVIGRVEAGAVQTGSLTVSDSLITAVSDDFETPLYLKFASLSGIRLAGLRVYLLGEETPVNVDIHDYANWAIEKTNRTPATGSFDDVSFDMGNSFRLLFHDVDLHAALEDIRVRWGIRPCGPGTIDPDSADFQPRHFDVEILSHETGALYKIGEVELLRYDTPGNTWHTFDLGENNAVFSWDDPALKERFSGRYDVMFTLRCNRAENTLRVQQVQFVTSGDPSAPDSHGPDNLQQLRDLVAQTGALTDDQIAQGGDAFGSAWDAADQLVAMESVRMQVYNRYVYYTAAFRTLLQEEAAQSPEAPGPIKQAVDACKLALDDPSTNRAYFQLCLENVEAVMQGREPTDTVTFLEPYTLNIRQLTTAYNRLAQAAAAVTLVQEELVTAIEEAQAAFPAETEETYTSETWSALQAALARAGAAVGTDATESPEAKDALLALRAAMEGMETCRRVPFSPDEAELLETVAACEADVLLLTGAADDAILPGSVLEAAKAKGLEVRVQMENGLWLFDTSVMEDDVSALQLGIKKQALTDEQRATIYEDVPSFLIGFLQMGGMPTGTSVRLYVGDTFSSGDTVLFYVPGGNRFYKAATSLVDENGSVDVKLGNYTFFYVVNLEISYVPAE